MTPLERADLLDAYRIVPRLWMAGFAWLLVDVTWWFKALPDPSSEQTFLVSTVWGAGGWITMMYFNSGRKWQ